MAISNDSIESHYRFAEKLGGLPYPLLSDEKNEAIDAFGVLNDTQTAARRSIFIVDQEGKVGFVNPAYDVRRPDHFVEVFDELRRISGVGQS